MSDASDVPAVRYLKAYTPDDPPPTTRVCLCTSCDRYMHMTVVREFPQANWVDFLLRCPICDSDFVEQGWPVRDWANRPGGPVYPNVSMWADVPPDDLIILGQHVVGREDTDD